MQYLTILDRVIWALYVKKYGGGGGGGGGINLTICDI